MPKGATNQTIDPALLGEACSLNFNMSAISGASLRDVLHARKAAEWLEENRAAIQSSNEWVEKNGLPLQRYRQF